MLFLCVNVYCHRVTTQLQLINIIIIFQKNCASSFFIHKDYNAMHGHQNKVNPSYVTLKCIIYLTNTYKLVTHYTYLINP